MNDEPPEGDVEPEAKGPVAVPFRATKGAVLPEEWRQRMRKPHRSNAPVPGESAADKGLDMTGFSRMYKNLKQVVLTDEKRQDYLDRLLVHGKKMLAAVEVGVHYSTIVSRTKIDPSFKEDIDDVLRLRSQQIVDRLEEDALNGHQQLFYDKETGALVSEKTVYETPLRMAMLKRHDPEYVDKKEIEHTHRGGVLVVPGRLTPESWRQLFEAKSDPTQPPEEE